MMEKDGAEPREENNVAIPKLVVRQDSVRSNASKSSQASVDFETAVGHAGFGKFNYLLLLITFPAACTSCFDTAVLSFVLPVAACELGLESNAQKGILNSAIYAGMICSSFLWGTLSDMLGRQKLLSTGFLLNGLIDVASAFAGTMWEMVFFRFCSGFVIFGPYTIYMTYVAEVFGSKYSDLAVITSGVCFTIGSIIQPGLAIWVLSQKFSWELPFGLLLNPWRIFFIVCAIPSLVIGIISIFCVESPKFLIDKGRKEEALQVFKKIYAFNTGKSPETYPVKKLADMRKTEFKHNTNGKAAWALCGILKQASELLSPPYLTRAVSSFALEFFLLTTVDVMRLWLPQLFSEMKNISQDEATSQRTTLCSQLPVDTDQGLYAEDCPEVEVDSGVYTNMMLIYSVVFLSIILTNVIVRFVNKKLILVITAGFAGVIIILVSLFDTFYVLPLAAIFISLLNTYFYVHIAIVVELFPTRLRATGVSLTMMFCRLGTFVSAVASTKLLYINCEMVFYLFAAILFGLMIGSIFIPQPDDEGKEDIESKPVTA